MQIWVRLLFLWFLLQRGNKSPHYFVGFAQKAGFYEWKKRPKFGWVNTSFEFWIISNWSYFRIQLFVLSKVVGLMPTKLLCFHCIVMVIIDISPANIPDKQQNKILLCVAYKVWLDFVSLQNNNHNHTRRPFLFSISFNT